MKIGKFIVGRAEDVLKHFELIALLNPNQSIESYIKDAGDGSLCPYCGTQLEVEREVFGNKRQHSCRGDKRG